MSLNSAQRRRTRSAHSNYRPEVEHLETRELLATAVGMNLERVVDYNPDWMFTDAFLEARPWISTTYNTTTGMQSSGGTPQLDEHGWPSLLETSTNELGQLLQQRLETGMYTNMDGHYPAGVYQAEWEGEARLVWSGDARLLEEGLTADGARHQAFIEVTPSNRGIHLQLLSMDVNTPLHNLHLWLPDYNGQSFVGQVWTPGSDFSPFHPLYLERLAPFDTIRFMHPANAVTSDVVNWDQRKEVGDAPQTTAYYTVQNGLAPEYMIELCNELDANPWFCMPYTASDDYVRQFAQLVHRTLEPGQTVYVEWSDEIWNYTPGYQAHAWVWQQATATGRNPYEIWAEELRQDFAVWSEVFADQPGSLVRVVAGQAANSWVVSQVLQHMNGEFDAISCDAYVTFARPQLEQFNASTTVDQVVAALFEQALPYTLDFLQAHQDLADQYSATLGRDIQLLAYEGGPLLPGNGHPWEAAFLGAAHDPRLYDLIRDELVAANQIGVDLFLAYVYTDASPFGDSAMLNYQDQPLNEAHRYRAVRDGACGVFYPLTEAPQVSIVDLPATVGEGTPVELNCAVSDDGPLSDVTCTWTVTRAGVMIASGMGLTLMFTPPDEGDYLVAVTARDALGAESTAEQNLRVTNVAPRELIIVGPASAVAGQSLHFSANFSDPGSADTHTIRWRIIDSHGAILLDTTGASCTFRPVELGWYTVTCGVTDDDGGMTLRSQPLPIQAAMLQPDPRWPGRLMLVLGGTTGDDYFTLRATSVRGEVQVFRNNQYLGTFFPTSRIVIQGPGGHDTVAVEARVLQPVWYADGTGLERWVSCSVDIVWRSWNVKAVDKT